MRFSLSFLCLLLALQPLSAQAKFTKPSEAYEYANRPLAQWEAAVNSGKKPATEFAPEDEVEQQMRTLCPSFSEANTHGEELYWLAKLCKSQPAKALSAVELYLKGNALSYGPNARLLMAELQVRASHHWEASWPTYRSILEQDPIGSEQEVAIRVAIGEESVSDESKALEWSKERYDILLKRFNNPEPNISPVSDQFVLMAGSDLVYRLYLTGQSAEAKNLLAELDQVQKSHPDESRAGALTS